MRAFVSMSVLAIVLLAIALPTMSHAQDQDLQQWTLLAAQGKIADRVVLYTEIQPRFTDDVSRRGQLLLRSAVGYQITPDVTAFIGYAYVRTDGLGRQGTDEHRVFQQLSFPIFKNANGFTVAARTRLEQRTVVGAADLGWRLRQQLRAQGPIQPGGKIQAIAWTEPFYNFDTTDWGQRRGFDQVRTFIGLGVPITKGLTAEPGYLNQTVFRQGADRVNHVANLTLFYRY